MASNLFKPVKVGNLNLSHRVVLAPLTRLRADDAHVHGDLALEYYTQRAGVPGTLLIAEGTFLAPQTGGYKNVPSIHTAAQIEAWKKITDAVHAKGSYMYLQLWTLGRTAESEVLTSEDPSFELIAPSAVALTGKPIPRALTVTEIHEYVEIFRKAAENAVFKAGFDGVEFHMASGYLPDQFLQSMSNTRTDEYGGSIENRCRFPLEAIDAVVKAIGQERTAIRVSPWGKFQDMRMDDPVPTFSYFISRIRELYPQFGYLHVIEPRIFGYDDVDPGTDSNDFLRDIWLPKTFISAGGYTRESAMELADKTGELIAFGRSFIANLCCYSSLIQAPGSDNLQPDLPVRLKKNIPLNKGDRTTYYAVESAVGYIDYPFADD